MHREEFIGFIRELADYTQKLQMLNETGNTAAANELLSKIQPLREIFAAKGATICLYQKRCCPLSQGNTFNVTTELLSHWPPVDEEYFHAHVVLTYHITHTGHTEIRPGDVDVFVFDSAQDEGKHEKKDSDIRPRPTTTRDPVLSDEETKRFLKDMGLDNLL